MRGYRKDKAAKCLSNTMLVQYGVNDIEMRLWVAYGLIALVLMAFVASIFYIRYNRHDRKNLRRRDQEEQRNRDRAQRSDAPM